MALENLVREVSSHPSAKNRVKSTPQSPEGRYIPICVCRIKHAGILPLMNEERSRCKILVNTRKITNPENFDWGCYQSMTSKVKCLKPKMVSDFGVDNDAQLRQWPPRMPGLRVNQQSMQNDVKTHNKAERQHINHFSQ